MKQRMFFLTPLSLLFSLGNTVFKYSPERMEGDQLVTRGVGAQELKERRNKLPERILTFYRSSPAFPANLAILTNTYRFFYHGPGQSQMLETWSLTKQSLGAHKPVVQQWSTEIAAIREGCAKHMETQRGDKAEDREERHPRYRKSMYKRQAHWGNLSEYIWESYLVWLEWS